jgi:hypothetical protein
MSAVCLTEFVHYKGVQTGEMQWFIAVIRLTVSEVLSYYFFSLTFCQSVTLFYVGLFGPLKTTFFMVGLHIEISSPGVSFNYLLDVTMMKNRRR